MRYVPALKKKAKIILKITAQFEINKSLLDEEFSYSFETLESTGKFELCGFRLNKNKKEAICIVDCTYEGKSIHFWIQDRIGWDGERIKIKIVKVKERLNGF